MQWALLVQGDGSGNEDVLGPFDSEAEASSWRTALEREWPSLDVRMMTLSSPRSYVKWRRGWSR